MKKNIFLALMLTALLFASCKWGATGNTSEEEVAALTFDSISVNLKKSLIEGKEFPRYNIVCKTVVAADSTDVARRVNAVISQMIYNRTDLTPEQLLQLRADSVAADFSKDLLEFYDPDEEDANDRFDYTYEMKGQLAENARPGYLAYEVFLYSYQGGAHGSSYYQYRNIRLSDGAPMLKDDVFLPNSEDNIRALIMKELLKVNECQTVEELQEKTGITILGDVYINDDNFQLQADGILFLYNIYEIAPYASGPIFVNIGYEELKPYLQEL